MLAACRITLRAVVLLLALLCAAVTPVQAEPSRTATALDELLARARADATPPCADDKDDLERVLCEGRLRVGVRTDYPKFGTRSDGVYAGYEIDLARQIAARLGVALDLLPVSPANRIAMLGENKVDLVIATMGHTVQRDAQALFIRPHYYASETVVVGPRSTPISSWAGLAGATVCVTVGNNSNTELVAHNVRLLLFDRPSRLIEELQDGACQLVAQDDSFFAAYLAQPSFAARYDVKLGFSTVPWGMAVAAQGSTRLAAALSLLSRQYHEDGTFLALARRNGVRLDFLEQQAALWRSSACQTTLTDPTCLIPAVDSSLARLPFANATDRLEGWIHEHTGLQVTFPMFKTVVAFGLFTDGLLYTVILVAGAMACTTAFAFGFAAALWSKHRVLRSVARMVTVTLQSSPIVLLLFVGFTAATALVQYSLSVALVVAILVLGLFNGSYAGQSIAEIHEELRRERGGLAPGARLLASRSSTQITSFLINACKGSAAASMIGAPELLSALTDISSFSNERITLYTVLLLSYLGLVLAVMALCLGLRRWLQRSLRVT